MANCPNKNTAEYIALLDVYKTDLITTNVINSWQKAKGSEAIPTVAEAGIYAKERKALHNLKQVEFGQALLNNLSREKIIHNHNGAYYINNTDQDTLQISDSLIASNVRRARRYLEANNLPADSLNIDETPKTFAVSVNSSLFSAKDMLPQSRSWDKPRSRQIVKHLMKMFPNVNISLVSAAKGKRMYDSLPQWRKAKVPFTKVNSFYVGGKVVLIQGRVTDEIAIEEVLHPFIEAIKIDNIDLFEGLLSESKLMFPEMTQQIEDAYNRKRNITAEEREMEVVTQALSRHFNKEYEESPSARFLNTVEQLLEWFKNVIENLNEYFTGRSLPVSALKNDLTLTDVAKLLNTSGISFETGRSINGRVRYSLSEDKQSIVDQAIKRSRTDQQKMVIDELFYNVIKSKERSETLSGNNPSSPINNLVVRNKENDTFYDLETRQAYGSIAEAIGKKDEIHVIPSEAKAIRNDVSIMLDAIAGLKSFDEISESLTGLDKEIAKESFENLRNDINTIKAEDEVLVTNVVLADPKKGVAGIADVMLIDKFGSLRLSKVNIVTKNQVDGYSDVLVKLEPGNRLADQNNPVTELTLETQDSIEANLLRRMATNMGYKMQMDQYATSTIFMELDNNKLEYKSVVPHNEAANGSNVDFLIPESLYDIQADLLNEKLEEGTNDGLLYDPREEAEEILTDYEDIDPLENVGINTVLGAVKDYRKAVLTLNELIDKTKKNIYQDRSKIGSKEQIANTLAVIDLALVDPNNRKEISQAYTRLLQDAYRQMKDYEAYIVDPNNVKEEGFIRYVLGFERFTQTFEGLYDLKNYEGLNPTQRYLINNIDGLLRKLNGSSASETSRSGLVNRALFDYAEEVVRANLGDGYNAGDNIVIQDHSGMTFTMANFAELLELVPDISNSATFTKDMSTSKDLILATIDKVYKADVMKVLDKIQARTNRVASAGEKLRLLQPGVANERLYDFMLNFEENGTLSEDAYVRPLGMQYNRKRRELLDATRDAAGVPMEYEDVTNLTESAKTAKGREDIKYNKALSTAKQAYSQFSRAEQVTEAGVPIDGDYHKFTEEFKKVRAQNEVWNSRNYEWEKRDGVSPADYKRYRLKYYDVVTYVKSFKKKGDPTGQIIRDQTFPTPKNIYVEARLIAGAIDPKTGKPIDMRSAKYIEIMDPKVKDALSVARREYYDMFIEEYQEGMLRQLPAATRDQMLGSIPLIQSNVATELKKGGSLFTRLWAKSTRSVKNLFVSTAEQKTVILDELGEPIDSIPIFYTGNPRVEERLVKIENQITQLKLDYKNKKMGIEVYTKSRNKLEALAQKQRSQPTIGEVSTDLTKSLIQFNSMASHFEVMSSTEDTINALVKVLEKRSYVESGGSVVTGVFDKLTPGSWKMIGSKGNEGIQNNVIRRARMWQKMVLYDNSKLSKDFGDKAADFLVSWSSLSYVAFNPFGNINNLVLGQINNMIEGVGGRFFQRKSYLQAEAAFNTEGMAGLMKRTAMEGVTEVADVAVGALTLGNSKIKERSYIPNKPTNKFEGTAEFWRMMDPSADIRESGQTDEGSIWARFKAIGYVLQDTFEYSVQTKIGTARLYDIEVFDDKGNSTSLYDAGVWDNVNKEITFDKKWKTYIPNKQTGVKVDIPPGGINGSSKMYTDIRNEIREINKQVHGNYARVDRTVAQNHWLGQLIFQFHKWFPPAMRARFQNEYYDQNLGWMEGRYRSFLNFSVYAAKQAVQGNLSMQKITKEYKKEIIKDSSTRYDSEGNAIGSEIALQSLEAKVHNKIMNVNRTAGEASMIIISMLMMALLTNLWDESDDEPLWVKKLKNFSKYQTQRTYKEMVMFVPISPDGIKELFAMMGSPIASTRTLGELGNALSIGVGTLAYGNYYGFESEEFRGNSRFVYQNRPRKGDLKFFKTLSGAAPILSTLNKWRSFEKLDSWYIAN